MTGIVRAQQLSKHRTTAGFAHALAEVAVQGRRAGAIQGPDLLGETYGKGRGYRA